MLCQNTIDFILMSLSYLIKKDDTMTAEQMLIIIFIVGFAVGGAGTCIISEKIKAFRERRRRKEAYISYVEDENLKLKRTVNFLKFQAELDNGRAGVADAEVHMLREG